MVRVQHRIFSTTSLLAALVMAFALVAIVAPSPAHAAISRDAYEDCLLDRANEARAAAGIGELEMAYDLVPQVRDWSHWMRLNGLDHMNDSRRQDILPDSWSTWAENVAMHGSEEMPDCGPVHDLWMNSEGHRSNILNPNVKFVAIGTYVDASGWWATQLFFDASGYHPTCTGAFCDDEGSVYEASIELIAAAGITQGCNPPENNLFCPDERVTRGAMSAFLERALPMPPTSSVEFSDDNGSVFEAAIESIATAGITQGCNPPANTHFCPNDYVTRGQMAAFLDRALGLSASSNIDFVDDNGSVFESSIEKIAAAGITLGCNPPANTHFCPNDYVTRGQMAAFLARALDL